MSEYNEKSVTDEAKSDQEAKAPYESPQLTIHGKVEDITTGGGGTMGDSGGTHTMA